MDIRAEKLSKRFGAQWVIKDFSYEFQKGVNYAIEGSNGSGKSTLLHLCCTYLEPTKGLCQFYQGAQSVPLEKSYKYFSIAAPYLDLIPHFTITEQLAFTGKLKAWSAKWETDNLLELMELQAHKHKHIRSLSSGMRQRVRLITALASDVEIVFLDEPTTNLDKSAKNWFQEILSTLAKDKLVVIASNEKEDLQQCAEYIQIEDYK